MSRGSWVLVAAVASLLEAQTAVEVARVAAKPVSRTIVLNGEFLPYESVELHARISGFVEKVLVDRGSVVRAGELLVTLAAPEMEAQIAEARAKVGEAEALRAEAKAKLAAAESTYERLKSAAATPGAISGNELTVAEQNAVAARGVVSSAEAARSAAQAAVDALEKLRNYLRITAPFPGVVTERRVHPGALAGPSTPPLLRLEQLSRLRLVVAVPEADTGAISRGTRVRFRVAAFPERAFWGVIARASRSMEAKTRSMPVEVDVDNRDGALAPGMYPQVDWPVRSAKPVLMVPASSIVTTTERVFVIRVKNGRAEWVDVRRGARDDKGVEVHGSLAEGDVIVLRGTDEIREGAAVAVKGTVGQASACAGLEPGRAS